jgi:hypothetical protein
MNNLPKISKLTEPQKGFDIDIFKNLLKEYRHGTTTGYGILICIEQEFKRQLQNEIEIYKSKQIGSETND